MGDTSLASSSGALSNCQSWFDWPLLKQILMHQQNIKSPSSLFLQWPALQLVYTFSLIKTPTPAPSVFTIVNHFQKITVNILLLCVQGKALTYCLPTGMRSDALTWWRGTTAKWFPLRRTRWLLTWMWPIIVSSGVIAFTGKSTGIKVTENWL